MIGEILETSDQVGVSQAGGGAFAFQRVVLGWTQLAFLHQGRKQEGKSYLPLHLSRVRLGWFGWTGLEHYL